MGTIINGTYLLFCIHSIKFNKLANILIKMVLNLVNQKIILLIKRYKLVTYFFLCKS